MEFPDGEVNGAGPILEIIWKSGRHQRLSAQFLRANCKCATCREIKFDLEPGMFPGLEITRTDQVGSYAFQFYFSDGHKHGAYPYATLEKYPDEA
jgi:DUF971 family protein